MNSVCDFLKAIWEGFVFVVTSTIPEEFAKACGDVWMTCINFIRDVLAHFVNAFVG